jgi:RHS repeat-associated protein
MGQNPDTGKDEGYDFKGNLLRGTRQFAASYIGLPDWNTAPRLEPDLFTSSTQYDALNRPIAATTRDGSVVHPTYNEANFLASLSVNLRGAKPPTPFVTNIDYDAKGQRILIEYGNNTRTQYTYDLESFRLTNLVTTRPGFPQNQQVVQDLSYTYDPVGNITHIQDDADIQNVVFFRNQRVEPSNDYAYDAIYRLISASGREQLGLGGDNQQVPPTASSYNDVPRVGLSPMPGDGNTVGLYREFYQYDRVGNFLQFIHKGPNPANPGWTRSYTYNETSLLEPGKVSNRLTSTAISGNQPLVEPYTYDGHGNMASMPQLQAMEWDFKDELLMTRRQAVNASDDDGALHQGEQTYYVYDAGGQRARKINESSAGIKTKERFYVGGFEVYREYDADGAVTLERETLHIMDDRQRVALVETRTVGNDGSPAQLVRYQFGNHLGSAALELDDLAQIISYEEYCPYGNTSYQGGHSATEVKLKRYRYTGMERDDESGLNYHNARYYATWLGRWTSFDPVGLAGGWDGYAYALNNPVRLGDRFGRQAVNNVIEDPDNPGQMLPNEIIEIHDPPDLVTTWQAVLGPGYHFPSRDQYERDQEREYYRNTSPDQQALDREYYRIDPEGMRSQWKQSMDKEYANKRASENAGLAVSAERMARAYRAAKQYIAFETGGATLAVTAGPVLEGLADLGVEGFAKMYLKASAGAVVFGSLTSAGRPDGGFGTVASIGGGCVGGGRVGGGSTGAGEEAAVAEEALERARNLMARGGLPRGQRVLGFGYDTVTGERAFVPNLEAPPSLDAVHPALQDFYGTYPGLIEGDAQFAYFGPPGAHGEFNALNELLWKVDPGAALTQADIGRFSLGAVWLGSSGPSLMARCPNCWFLTSIVNWIGPLLKQ